MFNEKKMSIKTGKCSDCEKSVTLDAMIRDNGKKGSYHCVDCEVKNLIDVNDWTGGLYKEDFPDANPMIKDKSNLKKLMEWCFG